MDFRSVQGHFAACIRDGSPQPPPPGVQDGQMAVYADLFRRNIDGLLGGMLPVFRQAMGEVRWQDMVRDFLRRHRSSEPLFRRLLEEFLDYLANERGRSDDPGFALELAHFEWLRLHLDFAEDTDCTFGGESPTLDDRIVVSPLAHPLRYDWPVHQIDPRAPPSAPPDNATWLIAWRNRRDEVRVIESNAVTVRLLNLIGEGARPGAALATIASELGRDEDAMHAAGVAIVTRLHRDDILTHPCRGA
ncbi:MAG: DUF2063 domain-containing protein [Gammaproteobacteria bacterium]|nr:DUF2063 domain-containing protein [Gammaproteobacteria bacterium]